MTCPHEQLTARLIWPIRFSRLLPWALRLIIGALNPVTAEVERRAMGHPNRSFVLGCTFSLMFVSLLIATQVDAQTGKDPRSLACTDPSCPKINIESAFANGPEKGSDLASRKEPAEPVQPQVAPKNDRLFWVLPNYLTVENLNQSEPLSAGTKFKLSAKTMSDPVTISFLAGIALMGQARNSDPSYGQGFKGYEKRFGTIYADSGIGTLMTTSVFPTLLHQDPRYFQLDTGGTWHRAMYSMSRILVTRADSGELQFNYSEIVGNAVAAGISNTYHPQSQRTLGNTVSVWGTDILLNMVCNVAKEFWPDIRRKMSKQKHPD